MTERIQHDDVPPLSAKDQAIWAVIIAILAFILFPLIESMALSIEDFLSAPPLAATTAAERTENATSSENFNLFDTEGNFSGRIIKDRAYDKDGNFLYWIRKR